MKRILMLAIVGAMFSICARDLYVDADNGNDGWSGTSPVFVSGIQGPRKTIEKVLSLVSGPGDVINVAPSDSVYGGGTILHSNTVIRAMVAHGVKVGGCITFSTKYRPVFGGGVYDVVFTNATSGAVSIGSAMGVVVSNCQFKSCRRDLSTNTKGGAVGVSGCEATFVDCDFTRCAAGSMGGAIYGSAMSGEGRFLTLRRCNFTDNICSNATSGMGGAIYIDDPEDNYSNGLVLESCGFTNNIARLCGGAIGNGRVVAARNCTFVGNEAGTDGGVSHQCYGTSTEWKSMATTNCWYDCTFISNSAARVGGVATCASSGRGRGGVLFSNCTFTANSSYGGGAVVGLPVANQWDRFFVESFEDCRFRGNRCLNAVHSPGGSRPTSVIMFAGTSKGLLRNCLFEENWSAGSCCGIHITVGKESSVPVVDIENTIFRGNVCAAAEPVKFDYGGVVYVDYENFKLSMNNCLVVSNVNHYCDGMIASVATTWKVDRSIKIRNCTIADNKTVGSNTHGFFTIGVGDEGSEVVNSIMYGNLNATNAALPAIDCKIGSRSGSSFDFGKRFANCLFGVYNASSAGTKPTDGDVRGNYVGRDPKFVHDGKHDYWLWRRSPAYATGLKQEWMDDAKDLAGNPVVDTKTGNVNRGCFAGCVSPGLLLLLK